MAITRITIGRSPESDIVVDERWETVSNNHADITLINGNLVFNDHSSNGTVINRQKIHNLEVGIYPGDNILLAGVYELKWEILSSYFPQSTRPTVTRNIRGEQNGELSRKTVQINNISSDVNRSSRATEHLNTSPQMMHSHQTRDNSLWEQDSNFGKKNAYSQAEMDAILEKWNWGGFFTTWIWACFHRIYWPLFIIPVALVPYIGQIASLALSVYLGISGSKLAWHKVKSNNFSAFVHSQTKWAIIGLFIFIISILMNAAITYYILLL